MIRNVTTFFSLLPKFFLAIQLLFLINNNCLRGATFTVNSLSALQSALNTASNNGENDTIIILNGTYNVTSKISFWSSENYSVYITGSGSTVLDGNNSVKIMEIITTSNAGNIYVKDLTVKHGRDDYGGGIYLETSSAEIHLIHCTITDNVGNIICGGADLYSNSGNITVDSCTFERNSAPNTSGYPNGTGGGLFVQTEDSGPVITLKNSYFSHNTAQRDAGGAMLYPVGANSTIIADNNTFIYNTAQEFGGGFWARCPASNSTIQFTNNTCTQDSSANAGSGGGSYFEQEAGTLTMSGNTFSNNYAAWQGGGVWISNNGGTITVYDNTCRDNVCTQDGGGLYAFLDSGTATLHHNIFDGNTATQSGGGFNIATTSGAITVNNNTSYSNTAGNAGDSYFYFDNAAASLDFYQNILYQSSSPAFDYSGAISVTATYSDIQGGSGQTWYGTGCIDQNPLFNDPANGDFNLTWTNYPVSDGTKSPCIDSGNPSKPKDPDSTTADMGALYFEQDAVWNGNINSQWNNAGNWSTNSVPTAGTNVLIPSGTSNYPVISTSNNHCKKITLKSGSTLTLDTGGTLTVSQNGN